MTTGADERRCAVCGGTGDGPCQTPSGRHWWSLDGNEEPIPDILRIAMTDPALRTPEEQALIDGESS